MATDEVNSLADEAALAFIQRNDVNIQTDSPKYHALVRAFVIAYEAGQRDTRTLSAAQNSAGQIRALLPAGYQPTTPVTYDAPYDKRCFYCRNKYCHPDSAHEASIKEGTGAQNNSVDDERLADFSTWT